MHRTTHIRTDTPLLTGQCHLYSSYRGYYPSRSHPEECDWACSRSRVWPDPLSIVPGAFLLYTSVVNPAGSFTGRMPRIVAVSMCINDIAVHALTIALSDRMCLPHPRYEVQERPVSISEAMEADEVRMPVSVPHHRACHSQIVGCVATWWSSSLHSGLSGLHHWNCRGALRCWKSDIWGHPKAIWNAQRAYPCCSATIHSADRPPGTLLMHWNLAFVDGNLPAWFLLCLNHVIGMGFQDQKADDPNGWVFQVWGCQVSVDDSLQDTCFTMWSLFFCAIGCAPSCRTSTLDVEVELWNETPTGMRACGNIWLSARDVWAT